MKTFAEWYEYENFDKLYEEFHSFYSLEIIEEGILDKVIPGKLKKASEFITKIKDTLNMDVKEIVAKLKDKQLFKFLAKFGFSIKKIFDFVKKGFDAYQKVIGAIAEYVSQTGAGKWTEARLKDLNEFLDKHPLIKKMSGVVIAGILAYIWLNMTFTGDAGYDFNMTDMIEAFKGNFDLSQLFAGPDGLKLLMLFATGVMGISFPWPGAQSVQFISAIGTTLLKNKLSKAK
jgi:hypothetical protein